MTQAVTHARVALPGRDEVTAETAAIYDHVMKTRGMDFMPNVFKALGNSPGALRAAAAVGEFVRFHTDLDPALRELAILTVAQESRCVYEWTHHWAIAERLGVPASQLNAIGTAAIEQEAPPLGPALRYVLRVARNKDVDDDTVAAVEKALGVTGLVDLTLLAGYYGMLARFINTMRVPLEDGAEAKPFVVKS